MDTTPQTAIDSAISMLCGDAITQSQWLDVNRRSHDSPELRLVVAVLEDALRCVSGRGNVGAVSQHYNSRREGEARGWLRDDSQGVFSFRWTCETLGLDAEAVRARLASKAVILQRRRSPSQGYREKIRA